jgi:hypothetical protein
LKTYVLKIITSLTIKNGGVLEKRGTPENDFEYFLRIKYTLNIKTITITDKKRSHFKSILGIIAK